MTKKKEEKTIVMAASEVFPFSKTGGLGDVTGALSPALASRGFNVHVVTPLYRAVDCKKWNIPKRGKTISVPISSRIIEAKIYSIEHDGVTVHFIDAPAYFDRDGLYQQAGADYPDNLERFSFFAKAVIEAIVKLKLNPYVIHCHDWQAGLLLPLMRTIYHTEKRISNAATVLTIHNLGYQGTFDVKGWHLTGLPYSLFQHEFLEFHSKINVLKGGIVFADIITTVSPTYAKEILGSKLGYGLSGALKNREDSLFGVLNGIDTKEWNPTIDGHIPANYDASDMSGKKVCKDNLLAEMGLSKSNGPLMGIVSRLVEQKGIGLITPVIEGLLKKGAKLVVLGSGEKKYERRFKKMARQHPNAVAVSIGYDEALAHRIEAGADLFLMPSLYEPCGLNQMYSLAYGTPPVVRATGGLADTVSDFDPDTGKGNGFVFSKITSSAFRTAVSRAIELYSKDKKAWSKMTRNGMNDNYSWGRSAMAYEDIYHKAVKMREHK